jgi:threonine aldolase
MTFIDLRSDTITQPTPAMREAMAKAEVGDDVYGEDPTVNRLQEMSAEMMGKEAGLLVTSGTMGNLVAVLVHSQRGQEVIMGTNAHTFLYEAGGIAAFGGVHTHTLPNQDDGTIRIEDIHHAVRSENDHHPRTSLVVIENTQNRCGGVALTREYTQQVGELAHSHKLKLHMDGARIFNAAAAFGLNAKEMVESVDSVTFCLSKGLCAPVGSVLCGDKNFIYEAKRLRKALGGGMRQAGILAAAGIVALEEMVDRVSEDHVRGRQLADGLEQVDGLSVDRKPNLTNMVFVHIDDRVQCETHQFVEKLAQNNVLVGVTGSRTFRLVTHYWIDDAAVEKTIAAFVSVVDSFIG